MSTSLESELIDRNLGTLCYTYGQQSWLRLRPDAVGKLQRQVLYPYVPLGWFLLDMHLCPKALDLCALSANRGLYF